MAPARKIIKEVVVQKALNGPVTISVPAQGLVTAKKRIEIYSEVQGVFRMGAQLFRTGQSYQSNEILLQIDAAEYLANVKSSRTNLYNQIAAILPDIRLDFSKEYLTWRAFLNAIEFRQAQLNLLNAETSSNAAKYNAKLAEYALMQLSGQLLNTDF